MDGLPISEMTPVGLLCLVLAAPYLFIAMGKLVPKSTVERESAGHTREMTDLQHDRDEWRAAHRISEQARSELADQVGELLEHARTTDVFIRSLPRGPGRESM